jgi:hypothetical protein
LLRGTLRRAHYSHGKRRQTSLPSTLQFLDGGHSTPAIKVCAQYPRVNPIWHSMREQFSPSWSGRMGASIHYREVWPTIN